MLSLNAYREMKRLSAIDPRRVVIDLRECLSAGTYRPDEFSLRQLAEHLVPDGREWVSTLDPRLNGNDSLLEAGEAVNTTQFSNITGQIVYSRMMEEYLSPAFVFTQMIPNVPTQFDGEKVPGIGAMGDTAEVIGEGQQYPESGLSEDWIETPQTKKRGNICSVTKEAVFFDHTGRVLREAGAVGEWMGINKEKRIIDCIVDENTTAHRYRWRGNTMATYGDNSGTHNFDNLAASNGLVDSTDINAAEQLLANMVDPNTGEPITVMADTLIHTAELDSTVFAVLNATMLALQVGGFAVTGNMPSFQSPNPISGNRPLTARYTPVTSRLLHTRMATDTSWFLGNPRKAFCYMENWPLFVAQAPPNSSAEFERDIVARYKASERGAAATLNPRYMVKSTA